MFRKDDARNRSGGSWVWSAEPEVQCQFLATPEPSLSQAERHLSELKAILDEQEPVYRS